MAHVPKENVDMSTYTEGQVHQLVERLESEGFKAEHITKLGQCRHLASIRAFLEGNAEIVMKKVEEVVISLLTLVKTITTPAVPDKKTSDCFTNKLRYYYRDSDMDSWLPKNQPEQPESNFSVQQLGQPATFKQAVESFLGVAGDIQTLSQTLKDRGVVTTLPTIESLIERQENGEDVGLRTDGYANPFFTEDKVGSVSVVRADRRDCQWRVYVYGLGNGLVWDADGRFFFRN